MGFELVEKGICKASKIKPKMIVVGKNGFSFGRYILDKLQDDNHMEVYLDRKKKLVGLKPTKNEISGFKVSQGKHSGAIAVKSLQGLISVGRYESKFEDGMFVITVPEIVDNTQTVKLK
jgi:hypothetical protein